MKLIFVLTLLPRLDHGKIRSIEMATWYFFFKYRNVEATLSHDTNGTNHARRANFSEVAATATSEAMRDENNSMT